MSTRRSVRHVVKLPKLSETVDEMIIIEWLVGPGEPVEEAQPLLIVETDKATVEVPSPVTGLLVERLVAVDEEVSPGTRLALIESSDR